MADIIFIGQSETPLPLPARMRVSYTDTGEVSRAVNGEAVRRAVRTGLRTLDLEWEDLTSAQSALILESLQSEFVYIKYPDPLTGAYRSAQFFCKKRDVRLRCAVNGAARAEKLEVRLEEK